MIEKWRQAGALERFEGLPPKPEVPEWFAAPRRCWYQLTSSRHYVVTGESHPLGATLIRSRPQEIPWLLIQEWLDRSGVTDTLEREFVSAVVMYVDATYLAWSREQLEKEMSS